MGSYYSQLRSNFTRYCTYHGFCEEVFKQVDTDKNDSLSVEETYIAVLKLYLKLVPYIKGLLPPQESTIKKLMRQNSMNLEEFKVFSWKLMGNIVMKVVVQIFIVFIFVPVSSNMILEYLCTRFSKSCGALSILLPDGIAFTAVSMCLSLFVTAWALAIIDTLSLFFHHEQSTTTTTTAVNAAIATATTTDEQRKDL